jgi:hypothetical protein
VPVTATANDAALPALTVALAGGVTIVGATGAGGPLAFTVSVAAALVTLPTGFVMGTL